MQTLIDQHGSFALPTSWEEVTTRQFCESDPLLTVEARAGYFAQRPVQVNALVADALEWMFTPPEQYAADGLNLETQAYEQVELIRQALSRLELNQCLPIVWGLYWAKAACLNGRRFTQDKANALAAESLDQSILFCWGGVMHCLDELKRLTHPVTGKYAILSEPDPTESARRAREAGADELLGIFGYRNVVKLVASQMNLREEDVRQLPWGEVAEHLVIQRQSAILADNIQRNASKSHE